MPTQIQKVSVNFDHTLMLGFDCNVYGYGKNSFGQLGLPKKMKVVPSIVKLEVSNQKIADVFTGLKQSWLVTHKQEILASGANFNKKEIISS